MFEPGVQRETPGAPRKKCQFPGAAAPFDVARVAHASDGDHTCPRWHGLIRHSPAGVRPARGRDWATALSTGNAATEKQGAGRRSCVRTVAQRVPIWLEKSVGTAGGETRACVPPLKCSPMFPGQLCLRLDRILQGELRRTRRRDGRFQTTHPLKSQRNYMFSAPRSASLPSLMLRMASAATRKTPAHTAPAIQSEPPPSSTRPVTIIGVKPAPSVEESW